MDRRWAALAVLFMARATMAYQFQAVAAVSPLLQRELGASFADIGILIGIYLAPGIVLAIPGGTVGRLFGDRKGVVAGFLLAIGGGLLTVVSSSWEAQVGGRLLAGAGGVTLTVLMTKMVADWFSGREMATAMAAYVNSWPAGIALALLTLSPAAAEFGVRAAFVISTLAVVGGLVLFLAVYRDPPRGGAAPAEAPRSSARLSAATLTALLAAGLIWTFYNVGFAMVFSFGPAMLVERGYTVAAAAGIVSITLWLSIISVPAGGWIADRTGRGDLLLVLGTIAVVVLLVATARLDQAVVAFAVLGLLAGLPAGSIMNLSARVLNPEARAIGMGIFYTTFYAGFVIGTALGGFVARAAETARATFDYGALLIALTPLLLALYRAMAAPPRAAAHADAPALEER